MITRAEALTSPHGHMMRAAKVQPPFLACMPHQRPTPSFTHRHLAQVALTGLPPGSRAANRRAAKAIAKGSLEEAVARALQPSYFFAMMEEDAQGFVLPDELARRSSMQTSRACSSSIIDLDDDFVVVRPPRARLPAS